MYDNQRLPKIRGGCLSDKKLFFFPLSFRAPPSLVSCPAGMVAKLIGLLQIRQRNCSRNGLIFLSLFARTHQDPSRGLRGFRTEHKSALPSFTSLLPERSYIVPHLITAVFSTWSIINYLRFSKLHVGNGSKVKPCYHCSDHSHLSD